MNAISQAQRAYSAAAAPTRTPRGIEYEAVARITKNLKTAADKGRDGFVELAHALHENRQLWDIFAIDVADPANSLPNELKARLFYLAEFTRHHTSKVLAREDDVSPLIDINTSIMAGLRGEVI